MEYEEDDRISGKVTEALREDLDLQLFASTVAASASVSTGSSAVSNAVSSAVATATPTTSSISLDSPLTPMELTMNKAATFRVALDSKTIMVCNQLVMVYWRQASEVPFGKVQGRKVMTAVEKSISDLANVFPHPRPKAPGVCSQQLEAAAQKHGAKSCGVYHFTRTSLSGINDPVLWLNNPVLWNELDLVVHTIMLQIFFITRLLP